MLLFYYEPLTLSLKHFKFFEPNSFFDFYRYEVVFFIDITKKEA